MEDIRHIEKCRICSNPLKKLQKKYTVHIFKCIGCNRKFNFDSVEVEKYFRKKFNREKK